MNEIDQIIIRISQILSDESHWCKGYYALTKSSRPVGYMSKSACAWCLRGAILKATEDVMGYHRGNVTEIQVEKVLLGNLDTDTDNLVFFNDHFLTTYKDVINLIDETKKKRGID